MFNAGQRPAIDSGLSVSRVGSAAQTKIMKKASKGLRMALANYREMLDFSRFGSDLDKTTQNILNHGAAVLEVLKQKQYMPLSLGQEIIDIYLAQSGKLDTVELDRIHPLLKLLDNTIQAQYPEIYETINVKNEFTSEQKTQVLKIFDTLLTSTKAEDLINKDEFNF